jgi:hypothetical protein
MVNAIYSLFYFTFYVLQNDCTQQKKLQYSPQTLYETAVDSFLKTAAG